MSIPASKHLLPGPALAALTAGLLVSWNTISFATAGPRIVVEPELRAAPSVTAAVVERLDAGTSLPFLLRRGQWLAVRNGGGAAWVLAVHGLEPDGAEPLDGGRCRAPSGDIIEAHVHERIGVARSARLRGRLGRQLAHDAKLARGSRVYVHASASDGEWILVEVPKGQLGWVSRCEIDVAARPGAAGDEVVVTRAGSLQSGRGGTGRSVASLSQGLRLGVVARDRDWVQLTADDGSTGWFPADRVRWHAADERDPASLWQSGMEIDWPCDKHARDGATHKVPSAASSVSCGDHLRIIRASGTEKRPQLLVVADDGRWGWVHDPVTPVAMGDAMVRDDVPKVDATAVRDIAPREATAHDTVARDPAPPSPVERVRAKVDKAAPAAALAPSMDDMPGMADKQSIPANTETRRDVGHEAMMGMGQGDMSAPTDGAAMSLSLQSAFPVGNAMASDDDTMMRTPRYEVSVTASGSGRLGTDYSYGLAATFSAARSLTADGQTRHEEYQGGQLALSLSRGLGEHSRLSVAGGYSLAFLSPGTMANAEWDFLAIHPGPFGRLSLSSEITDRLSVTLRGTAQLARDADGMQSSILMADAMAMLTLTSWLTAGANGMAMKMAMGDTMISAGPSLSVAFLKHFSATAAATAMSSGGMTMWTATTGMGVHF